MGTSAKATIVAVPTGRPAQSMAVIQLCPCRLACLLQGLLVVAIASLLVYFSWAPGVLTVAFTTQTPALYPPTQRFANHNQGVTSALTSSYRLLEDQEQLHVGDTAHFVIQAKDSDGRNKTFGGDFWFPVLTSTAVDPPNKGGRTAGSVVDHNNGTYSVFFYAGWEGTAYVHMVLAAPSEATEWLKRNYWPTEKRVFWKASFFGTTTPQGNRISEVTLCYLLRNVTSSEFCIIDDNPKAMGLTSLHCEKPKKGLQCEDFLYLQIDPGAVDKRTKQLLQGSERLFQRANVMQTLTTGPLTITITKRQSLTPTQSPAPVCQPDAKPLVNNGFWLNEEWHHLQCKVRRWNDSKAVRECLRHKYVHILGDSTIRSWFGEIMRKMGLPWQHLGTGKYQLVMDYHSEEDDLNMTYRFHPRVVTISKVFLNTTAYEVDVLDSIPSDTCSRHIFVFSAWTHFTQWTRVSYLERVTLLKEAVLRFRERCPDVPIVIKGAFPREHRDTSSLLWASDYTIWAWGRTLQETFRGTGVFYYDVWQMMLAHGVRNIHMPLEVISEEVNWFLSYVCK